MSDTLMRAFLDAVLPPGTIWQPAPGEDFDHFLDALGDNLQSVHDACEALAHIRDPATTPYLEELEREYGITPNTQLTDAQRRAVLALVKYKRNAKSTLATLQTALDSAGLGVGGYGLLVFANDPAVDPNQFIIGIYQMYLGGPNQYLGYNTGGVTRSFFGQATGGGLWIINGDVFVATPNYEAQLGGAQAYLNYQVLGSPGGFYLGEFYTISYAPAVITSPADSWAWPLVFFLATSATKDGGGHITALGQAQIPGSLRQTLIEIVMRVKPIHTWCVLMAQFA